MCDTFSLSKDNAAVRRRLPRMRGAGIRRILKYVEEADDHGLRWGRLCQQS